MPWANSDSQTGAACQFCGDIRLRDIMTPPSGENANSPLQAWVRALQMTAPIERGSAPTLPVLIDTLGERFGARPALVSADASLSYRSLADAVNRHARWALEQGLVAGDVVCLLMPNCPDYMAVWLGLTRVGVIVSLLNTNLTGEVLAHSINSVAPRYVIVAGVLSRALRAARAHIPSTVQCWVHGPGDHELPRLDLEVARMPAEKLTAAEYEPPALGDCALYIYTSGTTGLPKAANVSHLRLMSWSHWFAGLMDTQPSDRMYNCLPLYHSVGGVVATGATLVGGGTVVLRERFSATDFWKDVVEERCTLFQYIGELCRYLVGSPRQAEETQHALRLCCGNGLRADIWEQFRERFRIPRILEYYAATEGSFSLYNCEGRPGAIGRIPPFLAHRMPVALVKFDPASGAPLRNEAGRCVRCDVNETGEALGEISNASGKPSSRFEGYADAEASRRKLLRDVFAQGDTWYRTGDLMRKDHHGYFYFVDRVGETFRWKGENVSTTQIMAVITDYPGVSDAAVYGVAVPGADGRAGMAALVINTKFDLGTFRQHLATRLPDYARPLFLRLVPSIDITGTFKLRKQDLALQGYDPDQIADDLYLDDKRCQGYVRLDTALAAHLRTGKLRL
ncbi:MAG: long-chain-acyl-CoA synthetase [Gammaproteobacteria bacterium]|nr:long-chain-acyl-CoA synthetase [Gammaproteobacteria bacterium]